MSERRDDGKMRDGLEPRFPVRADFDPLSRAFLGDPFAFPDSLSRETPVFYAPAIDYYVVTRYADIEAVSLEEETYSAASAQLPLVPLTPEAAQILLAGGHEPQPSMVSRTRDHELADRQPGAAVAGRSRTLGRGRL